MTITNDWCTMCEESCDDHATICTVCGTSLELRPAASFHTSTSTSSSSSGQAAAAAASSITTTTPPPSIRPVPESLVQELQDSNRELRSMLTSLRENVVTIRQQVSDIRTLTAATTTATQQQQQQQQELPPEAMDPQQATAIARPTSKLTLATIPRTLLTSHSSLLQKATLHMNGLPKAFAAVAADFNNSSFVLYKNAPLIVATPRTGGKSGSLSVETQRAIREPQQATTTTSTSTSDTKPTPIILYMERGGGTSFVQKALLAQAAGASAVVIGNNTTASWPYVMKDSVGAATATLTIPVIMIQQTDAQTLLEGTSTSTITKTTKTTTTCTFQLESIASNNDCIICVECMTVGQTVVQLSPYCNHVFHESCAMQWLTQHHSCPYCRHELPTDDADYDADRRRRQTSNSTISSTNQGGGVTANNGDAFYG
eukprot:CAMPEP_0119029982 /NCGR_PEP_ID=MMETSP1176-20130426/40801_1 /TAXON_ID=265551 /ORGANISM="Synedropsis recta cf, Strain CCMP1620" /LENGTH=428 /DNA_ID=CAMNT_0006986345 /DNA_START=128 /DNA_END=1414 /DNA_ORIENTATION=+